MGLKENKKYEIEVTLITPGHPAYAKVPMIKKLPRKRGEPTKLIYPKGREDRINKRKQLLTLIDNINMNRTACAVHKALSREISRLNADEAIYRASRCSWHDIWRIIDSGDHAAIMMGLRNPRRSWGQIERMKEALTESELLLALKM